MFLRRLQILLNVRERGELLRVYSAGVHVQPNLQSQSGKTRNDGFTTKKPFDCAPRNREWFANRSKLGETSTRGVQTLADDDASLEPVTENSYARTIIANSKKDPKTIGLPLEKIVNVTDDEAEEILRCDMKSSSAEEILEAFTRLSCYASLKSMDMSQDKHGPIMLALRDKLQELDDEQLIRVFQCLKLWPTVMWEKCQSYTELWTKMDRECIVRFDKWSVEDTLMFFDYWYQLRLIKKAQYPWMVMRKLGGKPKKLNPINFLHFLFLVNLSRKPPMNMYEIEYRLDGILEEYTANELGVIAMAFFKTQTPLRDPKLASRMLTKVLQEWDDIEEISLTAIMKITRYSMGLKEIPTLCKVLEKVKQRVSNLSIPCLVHVAHAAAYVQCYDPELVRMIIKRFEEDIDTARLKDIERLCWILLIFNYDSKTPLFNQIVESLRDPKREEERERYPAIMATCLSHLSHVGIFPIDLIKKYLDPEFLQKVYSKNVYKIGWDYFSLENNIIIEFPDYDGPFLPDNIRQYLSKKYISSVVRKKQRVPTTDKLILEVAHLCKSAVGSDTAVHIDQVLPHFVKADIIICLDEANNPVAPMPVLAEMPVGTIKYAPQENDNLRWIAVVLATQNQMMTGTNSYIGMLTTKVRQLKKIGYVPYVVPFTEWRSLENLEAKESYLKNMLLLAPNRKLSADAV